MANRKIVVCGDSFCSATVNDRGHFSQVLEDQYDYQVINLARGGASMVLIAFQIQEAIRCQPLAIVHNITSSPRFDFAVNQTAFRADKGLRNFVYDNADEWSYHSGMVGNRFTGAIVSDVAQNFMPDAVRKKIYFDQHQQEAAKLYLTSLYSDELKSVVDQWIHDHWSEKIRTSGIVSVPFLRNNWAKVAYDFAKIHPNYPCLYHTDLATQKVLAHNVHELLSH